MDHSDAYVVCISSTLIRNTQQAYSRLRSIDCIKGLVQKQSNRPRSIHPRRTILIKTRSIVEHRQDVDDDETKAGESDLSHAVRQASFLNEKQMRLTAFGAIDIGMSLTTLFHQYGLSTYREIKLLSTPTMHHQHVGGPAIPRVTMSAYQNICTRAASAAAPAVCKPCRG